MLVWETAENKPCVILNVAFKATLKLRFTNTEKLRSIKVNKVKKKKVTWKATGAWIHSFILIHSWVHITTCEHMAEKTVRSLFYKSKDKKSLLLNSIGEIWKITVEFKAATCWSFEN